MVDRETLRRQLEGHLESLRAAGVEWLPRGGPLLASGSLAAEPSLPAPPSRPAILPAATPTAPASAPVAAALTPAAPTGGDVVGIDQRRQALTLLAEEIKGCMRCPELASTRTQTVFADGQAGAELCFVGEAPGADEDRQGEPFVGAAGQLLTKMIQAMGLARDSVYIANILKCRPDTPGQAYGNRKPTPEEMQTCISWLHEQIDIIRPKVLVGLGATAIEGLLGKTAGIMRLRGQWHTYRDIPLMPTYHPAFLLRNQAVSEKRKVWEDLLQVMEKLNLPITEKQRAYFLKG